MPARVVLVHSDPEFARDAEQALRAAGHDVIAFSESLPALNALEKAQRVDLLITRFRFSPGNPNGLSLALMARSRRPGVKVVFTARPNDQHHAEGIGWVVVHPIGVSDLLRIVAEAFPHQQS